MEDSPQEEQMTNEGVTDSDVLICFPPGETSTSTESVNDETTPTESTPATPRYPSRVHVPPDRLSYK